MPKGICFMAHGDAPQVKQLPIYVQEKNDYQLKIYLKIWKKHLNFLLRFN